MPARRHLAELLIGASYCQTPPSGCRKKSISIRGVISRPMQARGSAPVSASKAHAAQSVELHRERGLAWRRLDAPTFAVHIHASMAVPRPGFRDEDETVARVAEVLLQQRAHVGSDRIGCHRRIAVVQHARDRARRAQFGAPRPDKTRRRASCGSIRLGLRCSAPLGSGTDRCAKHGAGWGAARLRDVARANPTISESVNGRAEFPGFSSNNSAPEVGWRGRSSWAAMAA